MAKRIIQQFGIKSLDIIENNIQDLSKVIGIGKKRIEQIKQAWEAQSEVRSVMIFLQSHGVSSTYAARIFKKYGQDSIARVKENPYRLARDISGIGFIMADHIAESLGVEKQSPRRIEAGLEFVLNQLAQDGAIHIMNCVIKSRRCWMLIMQMS